MKKIKGNDSKKKSMKKAVKEKIICQDIVDEIIPCSLMYSAVGISRMIPSVVDGLKATQRKVLFIMMKNKIFDYTKNNKVIGDVTPYVDTGDDGIYGSLIRLCQEDRYKRTPITGHGNVGYISGGLDEFAAARYTESKLSEFGRDCYFPPEWQDAIFDESYSGLKYPTALPSVLPMGLILGSTGVSTGYKNDCPPHNFKSVGLSYIAFLKDLYNVSHSSKEERDKASKKMLDYVLKTMKPEFPNKCIVHPISEKGIYNGLTTGKGKLIAQGKIHKEDYTYGRSKFIVTELPYLVSPRNYKASFYGNIRAAEFFSQVEDYSGKDGTYVEIVVKKDVDLKAAEKYIKEETAFTKQFNYTLYVNHDKLAYRFSILDIFTHHHDYRLDCMMRYYNRRKKELIDKKAYLVAVKYIIATNESRRDKFIKIVTKASNKDIMISKIYKEFSKEVPLNNEIIEYVVKSRFDSLMNSAEEINKKIKEIDMNLKEIDIILEKPEEKMIKDIEELIKKYK